MEEVIGSIPIRSTNQPTIKFLNIVSGNSRQEAAAFVEYFERSSQRRTGRSTHMTGCHQAVQLVRKDIFNERYLSSQSP